MTLNPNWPVIDYAVCWPAGRAASPVQDHWCSVAERTEGKFTARRGKQYELDQVQPGEASITLRNDDGAFDPANMSSPYAGYVIPHRLFRARAQWPGTVNLLTGDQATAFFVTEGGTPGATLPASVSSPLPNVMAAHDGTTNAYVVTVASGLTANSVLLSIAGFSVAPGVTYTAQVQAETGTAVAISGYLQIAWYSASGTLISVANGAAAALINTGPTGLTVTAAAPANAAGAVISLLNSTSPGGTVVVSSWKYQIEKAAAASAWVLPGVWYPLFTGYIERWPQAWSSGGNYGTSVLTIVDLYSWLASRGLNWCAYNDVLALGPNFFYPLDEPAGTTQFADLSAQRPPMPKLYSYGGTDANCASGSQLQSTAISGASGYLPVGIPGPVVTFANPTSGTSPASTILNLGATASPAGPPTSTGWTRMLAFRAPVAPSGSATPLIWDCAGDSGHYQLYLSNFVTSGGLTLDIVNGSFSSPAGDPFTLGAVCDGGWHLVTVSIAADGLSGNAYLDGALAATWVFGSDMRWPGITFDAFGDSRPVNGPNAQGYNGDLAMIAEFPSQLSSAQNTTLYRSFRYAWGSNIVFSESSDSRYARILGWLGLEGPAALSAGVSVDYGPAVDVNGGTSPTVALAALQGVVDSEVGQQFIAGDGTVVFRSRHDRVNQSPALTFGEHAGEIPYVNAQTDLDPTRVLNDVTANAVANSGAAGTTSRVTDAASQGDYGDITSQRQVNTLDPLELDSVAQGIVYQNRQPQQRFEALPVDVGANPTLWPVMLGLELGTCVQANRRPSNAPVISIPGFVEQIEWSLGDDSSAMWTGQVSNAALHYFGQFDSATYGLFDSTLIFGY